jgi:hypothetical protein
MPKDDPMKTILFALSLLLLAGSARAQETLWSATAATCVPGDPAIQSNRYFITAGSVKYNGTASGLITLYCPIQNIFFTYGICSDSHGDSYSCPSFNSPNVLRLTYLDSDGLGSAVSVMAQLLRLSLADGSISSIPGALVNSSTSANTGQTSLSSSFNHGFDLQNFTYYVRVDMIRAAGSSQTATFYGVSLGLQ